MRKIRIKLDNSLKIVNGSDFGKEVFLDQVANQIDYDDVNEIDFGENIEVIGISFVQGFTDEIFNHISKNEFSEHFIIKGADRAVKKFMKALNY
jgi:hypothetical protein